MIPDAKWLDALKLPLRAAVTGALACAALLALIYAGVLQLGGFDPIARPLLAVLGVVFAARAVVGIGGWLVAPLTEGRKLAGVKARRALRREEKEEQLEAARVQTLARLDHLSERELHVVAKALRAGSPTFYTYVHSPPVTMLLGKGLAWTPGGQHHQDHYPFSFYDHVWGELARRREEFLAKATEED